MVNSSLAGIIAAICGAAGAFLGTLATVLWSHRTDARKRQREERDIVGRYRDALLQASEELQTPLRRLCDRRIPQNPNSTKLDSDNIQNSYDYCHLIYLIGKLFCWTYIIQNDIRDVHYIPTKEDHIIMNILYKIRRTLADAEEPPQPPFQVFKGIQAAIGEKMMITSNGGRVGCMGYAAFWNRWTLTEIHTGKSDKEAPFRSWFRQIEDGIADLQKDDIDMSPEDRISRVKKFQHLLVALSKKLDPENRRIYYHERSEWEPSLIESSSHTSPLEIEQIKTQFGSKDTAITLEEEATLLVSTPYQMPAHPSKSRHVHYHERSKWTRKINEEKELYKTAGFSHAETRPKPKPETKESHRLDELSHSQKQPGLKASGRIHDEHNTLKPGQKESHTRTRPADAKTKHAHYDEPRKVPPGAK